MIREVQNLLERLQCYFQDNPMRQERAVIPVSISFGVASVTDSETGDSEALLRHADVMLLESK